LSVTTSEFAVESANLVVTIEGTIVTILTKVCCTITTQGKSTVRSAPVTKDVVVNTIIAQFVLINNIITTVCTFAVGSASSWLLITVVWSIIAFLCSFNDSVSTEEVAR